MNNKYVKVVFGDMSVNKNGFKFLIDEVNEAEEWNPEGTNAKEIGGFNFSTEDKIIRWLVRGDTIYDVVIPEDGQVVELKGLDVPPGIFRSNKIILTNPRTIDDNYATELYEKSDLPEEVYFKTIAGCAARGYINTAKKIIRDKITKENIDQVIAEYNEFVGRYAKVDNNGVGIIRTILNSIKNME